MVCESGARGCGAWGNRAGSMQRPSLQAGREFSRIRPPRLLSEEMSQGREMRLSGSGFSREGECENPRSIRLRLRASSCCLRAAGTSTTRGVSTEKTAEPLCFGFGQSVEDLGGQADDATRSVRELVARRTLGAYGRSRQRAVLVAEPELPTVQAMVPVLHGPEDYHAWRQGLDDDLCTARWVCAGRGGDETWGREGAC